MARAAADFDRLGRQPQAVPAALGVGLAQPAGQAGDARLVVHALQLAPVQAPFGARLGLFEILAEQLAQPCARLPGDVLAWVATAVVAQGGQVLAAVQARTQAFVGGQLRWWATVFRTRPDQHGLLRMHPAPGAEEPQRPGRPYA